ncbi:hypothetical protein GGR57DRAFT_504142 [Xylariaceae sp. FL1272]|nr:hypothetical protein GGR57DRAFT_504142 [Xylariaceae sp. FL1272]
MIIERMTIPIPGVIHYGAGDDDESDQNHSSQPDAIHIPPIISNLRNIFNTCRLLRDLAKKRQESVLKELDLCNHDPSNEEHQRDPTRQMPGWFLHDYPFIIIGAQNMKYNSIPHHRSARSIQIQYPNASRPFGYRTCSGIITLSEALLIAEDIPERGHPALHILASLFEHWPEENAVHRYPILVDDYYGKSLPPSRLILIDDFFTFENQRVEGEMPRLNHEKLQRIEKLEHRLRMWGSRRMSDPRAGMVAASPPRP